jgi:hypothetical protein
MKLHLLALAIGIASLTVAKAATVTVSAGFNPSADIEVTAFGAPVSFTVAIGSWDGTNFVQFGQSITDTGSVNGAFTATGPTEVNNHVIHVWVGIGPVSTSGGMFALFRTATNTAFPSDVSAPLVSATLNMHNAIPGNVVLVTGNNINQFASTLDFIPEPSAALLGALGVVGLLRRRR